MQTGAAVVVGLAVPEVLSAKNYGMQDLASLASEH
jgi:hypothetical protein